VFASISKPRRGYYHVDFQMVEENPKGTYHGELTKRFAIYLEEKITANPDSWLWTHRRWKHKWKEGYKLIE
jgi:Kdo2-lipid IVA lauroyltransferase/acyltransferase